MPAALLPPTASMVPPRMVMLLPVLSFPPPMPAPPFAALSGEGAVLALVVLDGQRALRLMAVLLEARIVAAALQLVVAVQLDGRIVVALHGDGGIALPDRAVIAAIPLLLAADVDLQVVEGDVHVALGGVDGDGVLIRLAGDDGVGVLTSRCRLALCDLVRPFGVARFHGDVAVGDVPLGPHRPGCRNSPRCPR